MNTWTLKLIYHAIFDSHLNYVNTVCGQNKNSPNRLFLLQKKALRIISFECRKAHSNPLFYRDETVKLPAFLSVKLFPQTLVGTRHPVLQKDS